MITADIVVRMVVALMRLFDQHVMDTINEYVDTRPTIDWVLVYVGTFIYMTKHYITRGGGSTGGYVY